MKKSTSSILLLLIPAIFPIIAFLYFLYVILMESHFADLDTYFFLIGIGYIGFVLIGPVMMLLVSIAATLSISDSIRKGYIQGKGLYILSIIEIVFYVLVLILSMLFFFYALLQ